MAETIYREYFPDHDVSVELEYAPNAWASFHVSVNGYRLMSHDSLIDATADLLQRVAGFGGDAEVTLDAIVAHFDDDKIYRGEDDECIFLVNEYEWDEED